MSSVVDPSITVADTDSGRDITAGGLARILEHLYVRTPAKYRSVLVSGVVSPIFFLGLLGLGLGSLVDERQNGAAALGTANYLEFIGPGLLAISAVLWAFGQSLWPTAGEIKWDRTYLLTAVTPVSKAEIAVAHVAWIAIRFTAAAVLFTAVLVVAGAVASWWVVFAPFAAGATTLVLSSIICGYTVRQENEDTFPMLLRLGAIPMFLFSGAFFPLSEIPSAVAWLARVTPSWHGVELCRDLAQGSVDAGSVIHVAYSLVVGAIGMRYAITGFERALSEA